METSQVTCPFCFGHFEVATPPAEETPCEVDYDCEICCRPMVISFVSDMETGGVFADARSLAD